MIKLFFQFLILLFIFHQSAYAMMGGKDLTADEKKIFSSIFSIQVDEIGNGMATHIGDGLLLTARHVVKDHNVNKTTKLTLIDTFGKHVLSTNNYIILEPEIVFEHMGSDINHSFPDIAIIKLDKKSSKLVTSSYPAMELLFDYTTYAQSTFFLIGSGLQSYEYNRFSNYREEGQPYDEEDENAEEDTIQKGEIAIVGMKQLFNEKVNLLESHWTPNMIGKAGGRPGDSGGPLLVAVGTNSYKQVGVASLAQITRDEFYLPTGVINYFELLDKKSFIWMNAINH